MININRKLNDRFNRYTMPKLEGKVEGKGNGIKTVLVNMVDIAKALRRPPTYPTKYLGCALGAQASLGDKGRYIVNGQHECRRLQELLDGFIEKYVLCPKCCNPETTIGVSKSSIHLKCMACGKISEVEGRDRTFTYIVKNPPDDNIENADKNYKSSSNTSVGGVKEENGEACNKARAGNQKSTATVITGNGCTGADSGDFYQTGVVEAGNEEDEYSKYFSSLPKVEAPASEIKTSDEIVWSVDVSEEAVKKRRLEELSSAMSTLTYTEELDLSMSKRLEIFREFANPRLSDESCCSLQYAELQKEISRLELDSRAIGVVCECLFTSKDVVMKSIRKHVELFRLLVSRGKKVERCLLGVMEALLKKYHDLIPQINNIFSLLYQLDIVSENTFLRWHQADNSDYSSQVFLNKLQKQSTDFIDWLKNADEDEGEEDHSNNNTAHPLSNHSKPLENLMISDGSSTNNSASIEPSELTVNQDQDDHLARDEELELDIDAI